MNDKIKITLNHRVLDSIWNNDKIQIVILLLLLKNYIKGRTTSIELELLTYVFDLLRKDLEVKKDNVLLSKPWNISNLRPKLILAYEMNLIKIITKNNKNTIAFVLTNKGNELLQELENDILIKDLNKQIEKLFVIVKNSNLKKQQLTW
jgi:hypothetical protein